MNRTLITSAALGALTFTGLAAAPATAADSTLREGDFIPTLADTRSAGHVEFLEYGLHVYTDDATSNAKAAEYFAMGPQVPASASVTWYGTDAQPGAQIVFDMNYDEDADPATTPDGFPGTSYNILVAEKVYGDDVWMTGGSARAAQRGITCPETTGGSGSDCHGTLEQWQASLQGENTNSEVQVYAGGFSLGSGVKGDGVIDSIVFGEDTYTFTSEGQLPEEPETVEQDVDGNYSALKETLRGGDKRIALGLFAEEQPQFTTEGARLRWVVRVDGERELVTAQGFGDRDDYTHRFQSGTGRHVVELSKNGDMVDVFTFRTGR